MQRANACGSGSVIRLKANEFVIAKCQPAIAIPTAVPVALNGKCGIFGDKVLLTCATGLTCMHIRYEEWQCRNRDTFVRSETETGINFPPPL